MKTEMITSVEHLSKHQKGSRAVGLYTHDTQPPFALSIHGVVVRVSEENLLVYW